MQAHSLSYTCLSLQATGPPEHMLKSSDSANKWLSYASTSILYKQDICQALTNRERLFCSILAYTPMRTCSSASLSATSRLYCNLEGWFENRKGLNVKIKKVNKGKIEYVHAGNIEEQKQRKSIQQNKPSPLIRLLRYGRHALVPIGHILILNVQPSGNFNYANCQTGCTHNICVSATKKPPRGT